MSGVNKVILVGHLGADPELRDGNNPVCNMRLATSESWTDKDGQRQERTEWHRIVVWGKLGQLCAQHLSKGRQVYVEGRIQSREYADRDGNQRRSFDIVASNVTFLGSRDGRQGQGQKPKDSGWGNGGNQSGGWGKSDGGVPF